MMRRLIIIAILITELFFLSSTSSAQTQPHKFALVIGNGNYSNEIGPLRNPAIDADLVAAALTGAGFEVTELKNASRVAILSATERYSHKLGETPGEVVGFVYYSGHGLARPDTDTNFMIPVDVKDLSDSDAWFNAIPLDTLIKELQGNSPNATHFVVFDACRDALRIPMYTKGGSKGFNTEQDRTGVFIGFSTSPRAQASDIGEHGGPYALALAKGIQTSGIDHLTLFQSVKEEVFETTTALGHPQRAWESNGLLRRVYLNGKTQITVDGDNATNAKAKVPELSSSAPISISGKREEYCKDLKILTSLTGQDFLAVRQRPQGMDNFSTNAILDGFSRCSIISNDQTTFSCMTKPYKSKSDLKKAISSVVKRNADCLGNLWRPRNIEDLYGFEDGLGNNILISATPRFDKFGSMISMMISGPPKAKNVKAPPVAITLPVPLPVPDAAKPEGYCMSLKKMLEESVQNFNRLKGKKLDFEGWYDSKLGLRGWENCRIISRPVSINCELSSFLKQTDAEGMALSIANELTSSCLTQGDWTVHQRRRDDGALTIRVSPANPGPNVELRPRQNKDGWYINIDVQSQ